MARVLQEVVEALRVLVWERVHSLVQGKALAQDNAAVVGVVGSTDLAGDKTPGVDSMDHAEAAQDSMDQLEAVVDSMDQVAAVVDKDRVGAVRDSKGHVGAVVDSRDQREAARDSRDHD